MEIICEELACPKCFSEDITNHWGSFVDYYKCNACKNEENAECGGKDLCRVAFIKKLKTKYNTVSRNEENLIISGAKVADANKEFMMAKVYAKVSGGRPTEVNATTVRDARRALNLGDDYTVVMNGAGSQDADSAIEDAMIVFTKKVKGGRA